VAAPQQALYFFFEPHGQTLFFETWIFFGGGMWEEMNTPASQPPR